MKRRLLFVFIFCFTFIFHNLNGTLEDLTDENSVFLAKTRKNLKLEYNCDDKTINGVFDSTHNSNNVKDTIHGFNILLNWGNGALMGGNKEKALSIQRKLHALIKKITRLNQWTVKDRVIFLLKQLPDDCKDEGEYHLGRWSYINERGRVYLIIKELAKIHFKIPENRKTIERLCNKFLSQYNTFQKPYDDE